VWRRRCVGVIGRQDEFSSYVWRAGDDHIWHQRRYVNVWRVGDNLVGSRVGHDIDGRYGDCDDWVWYQSFGQFGVVYGERGR
jgi:hypothetical protein